MGVRGTKKKEKYQGVPGDGQGPLLLAVDTSSEMLNVVLRRGDLVLGRFESLQAHTHARFVLSAIGVVMEASRLQLKDVDVFGMCVGPGSFTGLRVGMAAVKGICAGLNGKPSVGVRSVEVLAQQAPWNEGRIVTAIDAKRGEVYFSVYHKGPDGLVQEREPLAESPEQGLMHVLEAFDGPLKIIGSACLTYGALFGQVGQGRVEVGPTESHMLSALALAECCMRQFKAGHAVPAGQLEPQYAREPSIG